MECREVKLKLNEYVQGRLQGNAKASVFHHIEECPGCTEELGLIRELDELLKIEVPVFAAEGFTSGVMDMIQRENESSKRFSAMRFPIINLGASLVLAGMLTILINTPQVNHLVTRWTDSMANGAATINTSIDLTTSQVESYIRNIINPGGR